VYLQALFKFCQSSSSESSDKMLFKARLWFMSMKDMMAKS